MKWLNIVTVLFRFCEMAALIGILLASYQIAEATHAAQLQLIQTSQTLDETLTQARSTLASAQSIEESLPVLIDHHLATLETNLNYQTAMTRGDLNHQIDLTRQSITAEISPISKNAVDTLKSTTAIINQTQLTLIPALASIQKASDEFPPLVRDLRFTAARSARTMGHVEQMSDAIAKATPAMTATTTRTSTQISGIATDVHTFTTSVVGPKPWYKKAWNVVMTGAGLSRFAF